MPVDNRRISAPENTVPYRLYTKLNTKSFQQCLGEAVSKEGIRSDGRKTNEHRKIFLKLGVVSQAKGSAYIECGKTKVIVSVFDPHEIPKRSDYSLTGELYCEFKFASFSCPKRRLHQQDAEEKQNSVIMRRVLESTVCRHQFPNFQVDIYALVLHNDGSALSAAINCAGAALAHASIPMFDIITSVTLGTQGCVRLLDPTLEEERLCNTTVRSGVGDGFESNGIVSLSVLSTHQQIAELYQTGNLSYEELAEDVEVLSRASKEVVPLVEKCLVQHVMKGMKRDVED